MPQSASATHTPMAAATPKPGRLRRIRPDTTAESAPPRKPIASEVAFSGPHAAVLRATADRLTWLVYDAQGTLRDALAFRKGELPDRFWTATEILALERNAERASQRSPEH